MKSRQMLIACVAFSFMLPVYGATSKHISHRIDAASLDTVSFEVPVVEMRIEVYDGEAVELEIDIRSQRRMWVFGRRNVDDIELSIDRIGDGLKLGIDEKNLEQTWKVRLPRNLALEMHIGVGEIRLDKFANTLEMELGVGEVRVNVDDTEYRSIRLDVGVGDTTIQGFEDHQSRDGREFVSDSVRYSGNGEHSIDIDVGVGEARVVGR
jgi:hypothetical protein